MRFTTLLPFRIKKLDGQASARLRRNGIKTDFVKLLSRKNGYLLLGTRCNANEVRKSFMIETNSVFETFDGTGFELGKSF